MYDHVFTKGIILATLNPFAHTQIYTIKIDMLSLSYMIKDFHPRITNITL